jgi:hypothetical protein
MIFNGLLQTRTPLSQQSSNSELEEKYKRVMMTNAQLDNEKQLLRYEVDLLKERLDDAEEQYTEIERQFANVRRVNFLIVLVWSSFYSASVILMPLDFLASVLRSFFSCCQIVHVTI